MGPGSRPHPVSPLPQNAILDLSKRSRSAKFRLVPKFKKEKNNKNKEALSSLGTPGTCPLQAVPLLPRLCSRARPVAPVGRLSLWGTGC